jgi:hypothetical protein
LVLLLAAGVAWQLAERYIGAEQFRPLLEEELSALFGLPAHIDGLDIYWWPQPHLAGFGVTLGDSEFGLSADTLSAEASLGSLWRGVLRLRSVSSDSLRIDLPVDDAALSQKLSHVTAQLFGPEDESTPSGESAIEIGQIVLSDIVVYRGGEESARVNLEIQDVLGPVVRVGAKALVPYLGPDSVMSVEVAIDSSGVDDSALSGTVETTAFPLGFVANVPLISTFSLTGTGVISGHAPGNVQLAASGQAVSGEHPELNGAFTGNLWYRNGQIDMNDLRLNGEDIQAVADLSLPPAGGFACRVQRGALDRAALATVAAAVLPAGAVSFSPEDGRMTVLDLLFGQDAAGPVRFSEGAVSFRRLGIQRGAGGNLPDLNARVLIRENEFVIEDLSNDHVQLSGTLAPDFASGETAVSLAGTANLSTSLVRLFWDDQRLESVTGRVRLETITGRLGTADPALTVVARIEEAGMALRQAEGPPLTIDTIHGGIRYEEGVLTLEELVGAGFALSGTVAPGSGGWNFDLRGRGELSNPLLALALPAAVQSAAGAVELNVLRGQWRPGMAVPEGLALEGGITDGSLKVETEGYSGTISSLNGTFSTDADAVTTDLRLVAEGAGEARIAGRYVFNDSRWEGEADLDLAAVVGLFLTNRSAERWMEAILSSQRDARVAVTIDLPEASGAPVQVAFRPRAGSGLEGSVTLESGEAGWAAGAVEVRGPVSAAAVAPLILDGLRGEGTIHAQLQQDPAGKRFTASADLKQSALSYGEWLRKPSGIEGKVELSGHTTPGWSIADIRIEVLGQSLRLQSKAAGMASDPFTLDLAALSPLAPGDVAADGTMSGTFTTAPPTLNLKLVKAVLPLGGGAGQIQADGGIRYQSGLWNFDDLQLQGPRTNCVVTASAEGNGWRGSLNGASLDLDSALLLAGLGSGGGSGGGGGQGVLAVTLDTLHVGSAAFHQVQGQLQAGGEGVRFTEARAALGTGSVAGTVAWTGGGKGQVALELSFDKADLSVIEALLMSEKRGMRGEVSGKTSLRFPVGSGREALAGLGGTGDLVAENGSYGQTNLATRILNLARTVEVIYLRMPSLTETGLTFDTSRLRFGAESGRVQISEFTLGTGSYGLEASGIVDFAADRTEMTGKIYAFETVTGILGSVPVLGSTVDRFKKLIALPLRISGPAFSPEVGRGDVSAEVGMIPEAGP